MFPKTKRKYLYGSSEYRETVIPGAFLNGQPLTYRMLLQNLGTEVAQSYKKDIWLDVLDTKLKKAEKQNVSLFIITDLRFLHEYNYLRKNNFTIIRVLRKNINTMTHISETEQDILNNDDFDYIVDNNFSINILKDKIEKLKSETQPSAGDVPLRDSFGDFGDPGHVLLDAVAECEREISPLPGGCGLRSRNAIVVYLEDGER